MSEMRVDVEVIARALAQAFEKAEQDAPRTVEDYPHIDKVEQTKEDIPYGLGGGTMHLVYVTMRNGQIFRIEVTEMGDL